MTDRSKLNKLRTACRELLPRVTPDMIRAWRPCRPIDDDLDAEIDVASEDDLSWSLYHAIRYATGINPDVRAAYLHYLDDLRLYCIIRYAIDIDPTVRASHLPRLDPKRLAGMAKDFNCTPAIASIREKLINR